MDVTTLRYLSVNREWFIDYIAWCFITQRGEVMRKCTIFPVMYPEDVFAL